MSWRAIAWAKQTKVGDATRKAILLVLADYADEDGSCYPSQARVADEAETSERTVRRALAEFEQRGIVTRKPRYTVEGRTSDRIYLNLDWALNPTLPLSMQADSLTGGQPDRWPGEAEATGQIEGGTGHSLAGEPSEEPLEEPPDEEVEAGASTTVESLCDYLARGIAHHGTASPKITKAWRRDMDLLLRRGPVEWARASEISEETIRTVIRELFTRLTVPHGDGFCWADQVQSPGALRKHWVKINLALARHAGRGGLTEARRMYERFAAEEEAS